MINVYIASYNDKVVYVGISNRVDSRWKLHNRLLKQGKHYNIALQDAYNDNGEAPDFKVVAEFETIYEAREYEHELKDQYEVEDHEW